MFWLRKCAISSRRVGQMVGSQPVVFVKWPRFGVAVCLMDPQEETWSRQVTLGLPTLLNSLRQGSSANGRLYLGIGVTFRR